MSDKVKIGSNYLPDCHNLRWDDSAMSYWCRQTGNTVSHMDGYTGICEGCEYNRAVPLNLKARASRILQIEKDINRLDDELRSLYNVGLSRKEKDALRDMVDADHKPHRSR